MDERDKDLEGDLIGRKKMIISVLAKYLNIDHPLKGMC